MNKAKQVATLKKISPNILFIVIFLLCTSFYNMHKTIFYSPTGTHAWRQADGASIALNYYQNGMNFFEPELLSLTSDNYTSGAGVSEATILYYMVAILYKIFGFNDFWFRFTNLLITFFGLFYLFRLFQLVLKDSIWALFLSFLPFCSVSFGYFANSFITDFSAINFIFIGSYHTYLFFSKKQLKFLIYASIFFTIAGLLKITSLIFYLAFTATIVLAYRKRNYFTEKKQLIYWLLSFFGLSTIVGAWYYWAIKYNEAHCVDYFANHIYPVWSHSWEQFVDKADKIWDSKKRDYFTIEIRYFLAIVTPALFLFIRKFNRVLIFLLLISLFGTVAYFSLWFAKLTDHGYYFAAAMPFFIFVAFLFVFGFKQSYPVTASKWVIKIPFIILLYFSIVHTQKYVRQKFQPFKDYVVFKSLQPLMREAGISRHEKVISVSDPTNALSLYLMNNPGWTQLFGNTNPYKIWKLIDKGAGYIVVCNEDDLNNPLYQHFYKQPIVKVNGAAVFSLKELVSPYYNFDFKTIHCNVDSFTTDKQFLYTSNSNILLNACGALSTKNSFNGKYALELDKLNLCGFTAHIPNVNPGDTLVFSIMAYGIPNKGELYVSNQANFEQRYSLNLKAADQWQEIKQPVVIPVNSQSNEIMFYFINYSTQSLFLDKLVVRKIPVALKKRPNDN